MDEKGIMYGSFFNDIFGDMPDKTMGIFMQAALNQSSGNVAPRHIYEDIGQG